MLHPGTDQQWCFGILGSQKGRKFHHQGHLLSPPPATSTPAAVPSSSSSPGVEIGAAVETEVREVKRMLRSFMAKLSQRDVRERNAFEWRIVALALDRLFFILYLVIILLALASMFPWREVFALPKLAKTAAAAAAAGTADVRAGRM